MEEIELVIEVKIRMPCLSHQWTAITDCV